MLMGGKSNCDNKVYISDFAAISGYYLNPQKYSIIIITHITISDHQLTHVKDVTYLRKCNCM